ncbi:biorientation of chromosomes in cell division protein 1-like 1 isoform X4 [Oncorhynchus keta]|uniref:biorientation of chromosomes in cell division protein 1-like 1 isoform X4 n=1 Tax=Oncorhynchus keta TaxID=8018 RepID=UPI00227D08C5|nr:biorientation of chromosomes in cell division protein 1-like 1 isoform X4 [Oncorhynchus keta]
MAGLPPGDPQLVSMIVNHLKTQGLFDQFRRDCLADVDTKPAYLNLRQRVDNFVSNHLSNHTWSPHLNKNQLRNNIRQLVLQSGMLEQGVDRIVAQVVDPKIHHTFRPQVERVVREFMSPGSYVDEPPVPPAPVEEKQDFDLPVQAPSSAPTTSMARDAMSILDTITTLNQEASSRASSSGEKGLKGGSERDQDPEESMQESEGGEQDMSLVEEGEEDQDRKTPEKEEEAKLVSEAQAMEVKTEDVQEQVDCEREGMKGEGEEVGTQEEAEERKEGKTIGKLKDEVLNKDVDPLQSPNEKHHINQKARERLKEEYSLEDSDLDGLSDITVSSVHTSDLSSFEEDSDDEQPLSDSTEDGEVSSEDEKSEKKKTNREEDNEESPERKPRRQAYVHKPFLYSRYYSDSDDEVTVEQRRRSAAKDKEERLLKRQQNRERMEEKRRQKSAQLEDQESRQQTSSPSLEAQDPRAKEALKEKKVLEKKMALSRKRKWDSRKEGDVTGKRKGDAAGEFNKKEEAKGISSKSLQHKSIRKVSESAASEERHRRKSVSTSEESGEPRKLADKSRTHSFILDLEQGSESPLKQRAAGKFDRLSRKELNPKERKEKECSLSDERSKLKQKLEKRVVSESHTDEPEQNEGAHIEVSSDDKGERKSKVKGDKKVSVNAREGRASVSEGGVSDEGASKEATTKKGKAPSVEAAKVEKDREKEKNRENEKERERTKAEKIPLKTDPRQLLRPDSTGSSEERSDMEPGSESIKKKDKHPKEVLKRSKSHTEDKYVEKPKSKPDIEKEKLRTEHVTQENQKPSKSSSETDKDSRKSRETEPGMKVKIMEKSRSKSREDKKAQCLEVKNKGSTSGSRPDASKERKREGSMKEQRKDTQENPPEKMEGRSGKKILDKKAQNPEKKETQDERKGRKADEKSDKSSISSPAITEPPLKKGPQSKDASTDWDPTDATITTSASVTYDALSDVTPELEEDDSEMPLGEVEPRPLTTGADALLTLMDICTSADARLGQGSDITGAMQREACPELSFQEADIKMKEAALTLLSMDPESILSPTLVTPATQEVTEATIPALQRKETTKPVANDQEESEHVLEMDESDLTATASSEKMDEQSRSQVDVLATDILDTGGKDTVVSTWTLVEGMSQENKSTVDRDEEKPGHADVVPEQEPVLGPSVDKQYETQTEKTKLLAMEHECPVKMDIDNINKDQTEAQEENGVTESGKCDTPEKPRETRRGRPSKLVKQASNSSKSDGQEDEKGSDLSEMEDKMEGRVTRKGRLSGQKATTAKDSGMEKNEKDSREQQSKLAVEVSKDNAGDKATDSRTPRRGRSSKTFADEEELKEPEKVEETPPRRGRRSGAQAKDSTTGNQEKEEEEKTGETSSEKPKEKQEIHPPLQKDEEEEEKRGSRQGRPAKPPISKQKTNEDAESSHSKEPTDTRKPAVKRKRSEESGEGTQPEEEGTQPEEEGTQPEEEGTQPEEEGTQPEEEGTQPEEEGTQPEEEGTQPEEEGTQPEEEGTQPEEEGTQPEEEGTQPEEEGTQPEEEGTQPEEEGTQPEEEGTQPEVEGTQPEVEGTQPEVEGTQPEVEGTQPEVEGMQESHLKEQEEKPHGEDSVSQSDDPEKGTEEGSSDNKTDEGEEDKDTPQKKPARRGRPSKGATLTSEEPENTVSEKTDKKLDKKESEQKEDEEEEETPKSRTATRAAVRLEAERNKPRKPSTRARGEEENPANTRGMRGQASASAKAGGRKREASPPTVRTRGGQKSEEPPSKKTKR